MQRTRLTREERAVLVDAIFSTKIIESIARCVNRTKRFRKKFRRPVTPGNVRGALNSICEIQRDSDDVEVLMEDTRDNMKQLEQNLNKLCSKL